MDQLLGDLCSCGFVVFHEGDDFSCYGSWLAAMASWFCDDIHSSPIEFDMYMRLLAGIEIVGATADFWWSYVDEYAQYKGDVVFLCYVHDGI